MTPTPAVGLGLIGAGRIGANHARLIAEAIPGVRLLAIADPVPGAADRLADAVGGPARPAAYAETAALLAHPGLDGVVVTAPARFHSGIVREAALAGKPIFCEKPASSDLAQMAEVEEIVRETGVRFQVGFNRRFAPGFPEARAAIDAGEIGAPQLLRSVTRDPGLANPAAVPPWTIFRETLIHDFDALAFLNPGARPVSVYAVADALVAPDFKDQGLLDTAVVTIRYDNGAIAVAEASFSAAYGYDTRAEVFGGEGAIEIDARAASPARVLGRSGARVDTVRSDEQSMRSAYAGELANFAAGIAFGDGAVSPTTPGVEAARDALAVAVACIESVEQGAPAAVRA